MSRLIREKTHQFLRWSEHYAKTDMVEFTRNNSWLFTGRIVAVLSGMVLTVAFANLLSPTAFGTYKYILAIAGFIGGFSILGGLGASTLRIVAQGYSSIIPRVFWISVLGNVPAALVAVGVAGYYFYMGNTVLGFGMAFAALSVLFSTSFGFFKTLLTGTSDFRGLALYGIPGSIFAPALIIATLFLTQNLILILASYFLGTFVFGLAMYLLAVKRTRANSSAQPSDSQVRDTIKLGFHLTLAGMVIPFVTQMDQLLLWHFVGPVELAIFAFAIAPVREIKAMLENFAPMMSVRFANRTSEELRASIPLRAKQIFLVSLIFAVLYVVAAPFIFKIFFPQYVAAVYWSQLLALTLLVQPTKNVLESAINAQGRKKPYYFTTILTQAVKLTSSVLLIPFFGLPGAIAAMIITDLATALIYIATYRLAYIHRPI